MLHVLWARLSKLLYSHITWHVNYHRPQQSTTILTSHKKEAEAETSCRTRIIALSYGLESVDVNDCDRCLGRQRHVATSARLASDLQYLLTARRSQIIYASGSNETNLTNAFTSLTYMQLRRSAPQQTRLAVPAKKSTTNGSRMQFQRRIRPVYDCGLNVWGPAVTHSFTFASATRSTPVITSTQELSLICMTNSSDSQRTRQSLEKKSTHT